MGVKLNPNDQWHITEILKASKEPFIMPSNYIRKYPMKKMERMLVISMKTGWIYSMRYS